ncbi:hypothetical protein GCM10027160_04370 [Streptomyces calidiresistens]
MSPDCLHCNNRRAESAFGAPEVRLSPQRQHRDPKVRAIIAHLTRDDRWVLREARGGSAHPFGFLMCAEGDCWIPIRCTPKGDSQYKILWRRAAQCTHGCAPNGPIPR